jgi:hypothetical protein
MAAPVIVPPSQSVPCLARLLAVLDRLAFGRLSAKSPSILARCAPIPAPHTFFPPFHSFLFFLTPHRRSILVVLPSFFAFLFVSCTLSIQDPPFTLSRPSTTLIFAGCRFPFPFHAPYAYAIRHLLDSSSSSTIDYSFICSSGQPAFTLSVHESDRLDTQVCAEISNIYIHFNYSPTTTAAFCALSARLSA